MVLWLVIISLNTFFYYIHKLVAARSDLRENIEL